MAMHLIYFVMVSRIQICDADLDALYNIM